MHVRKAIGTIFFCSLRHINHLGYYMTVVVVNKFFSCLSIFLFFYFVCVRSTFVHSLNGNAKREYGFYLPV